MSCLPLQSPLGRASLLCALIMGCNSCNKSAPSPAPKSVPKADVISAADPALETLPVPPGQQVSFDKALARVVAVRGLRKKAAVEGRLIKAEDLAEHLKRALAFERPQEVLRGTEQMLVGLGLVEPKFDFEATMMSLLRENLAGLYEPRLKLMLVRDDLPEETRRITLLHELVHALQDQYFDLNEIVTAHPDDSDVSSALSCLAEGDATSTMLDGVLPDGKTALDLPPGSIEAQFFAQAPKTNAPPLIIRSLYAPYLDGLSFVHQLRARGGFAEVNRVFRKPPISTEQVLHLDKYDAQEAPLRIEVPAPPVGGYKVLLHDIWGEQSLRLALEEWLSHDDAARGAAGWGGDRIVVYERGSKIGVAWDIAMDDEAEAAELWELLSSRSPGAADPNGMGAEDKQGLAVTQLCLEPTSTDGPRVALARKGQHVLWVGGPWDRETGTAEPCSAALGWLGTLLVKIAP